MAKYTITSIHVFCVRRMGTIHIVFKIARPKEKPHPVSSFIVPSPSTISHIKILNAYPSMTKT